MAPRKKDDNQHKSRRLALRKIRMNPETIAGKQVGHLANRQSDLSPFYTHINLGSDQVERRGCLAIASIHCSKSEKQTTIKGNNAASLYCTEVRAQGIRLPRRDFSGFRVGAHSLGLDFTCTGQGYRLHNRLHWCVVRL